MNALTNAERFQIEAAEGWSMLGNPQEAHEELEKITGEASYHSTVVSMRWQVYATAGWWEADERKRGWRETLGAAGFPTSEQHCAQGDWSSASGEQAVTQLLESFPDMDAVFVANDQMALSVLREVCRRGIRIPEQLAVIGFDDIPESNYFYPSLTTISQDLHLLGEKAVQGVVELIRARQENGPFSAQSLLITPKLVVRESSRLV